MVPAMIDRDYFRRQARTLRKMVKVAQDSTVADRLSDMADDFDKRAKDSPAPPDHGFGALRHSADSERGRS
jgi:hypothetical protein